MAIYTVTAYRYGLRDDHSYSVSVHTDLDEAKQAAESEVDWRGGKYGCEVMEFAPGPWDENREGKQVHYVESPYFGMLGYGCQAVSADFDKGLRSLQRSDSRIPRQIRNIIVPIIDLWRRVFN